eukprot:1068647-Rhodomonas_salina.1
MGAVCVFVCVCVKKGRLARDQGVKARDSERAHDGRRRGARRGAARRRRGRTGTRRARGRATIERRNSEAPRPLVVKSRDL